MEEENGKRGEKREEREREIVSHFCMFPQNVAQALPQIP